MGPMADRLKSGLRQIVSAADQVVGASSSVFQGLILEWGRHKAVIDHPLPVAGLDRSGALGVLFILKARGPPGEDVAEQWKEALQLAQVASDRYLRGRAGYSPWLL